MYLPDRMVCTYQERALVPTRSDAMDQPRNNGSWGTNSSYPQGFVAQIGMARVREALLEAKSALMAVPKWDYTCCTYQVLRKIAETHQVVSVVPTTYPGCTYHLPM